MVDRLSHFMGLLMTTRARFEKWAESSGWNIDRTDDGDYRTMSTDAAWGGWNACAEEAERVYSRECTEWARICEYQKRHGCKVGAKECAKLIKEWRKNNEAPNPK